MNERIAVIGLGYVGLPVALAFSEKFPGSIGFDIDARRVAELRDRTDRLGEVCQDDLNATSLTFTDDPETLGDVTFFVVAVPTPIDKYNRPDLQPLIRASEMLGRVVSLGEKAGGLVHAGGCFVQFDPGVHEEGVEGRIGLAMQPRQKFAVGKLRPILGQRRERLTVRRQPATNDSPTKNKAKHDGPHRSPPGKRKSQKEQLLLPFLPHFDASGQVPLR